MTAKYAPTSTDWVKTTVFALIFLGLYYSSYAWMITIWEMEDFNYGYMIPVVVLYLLWEKRHVFITIPSQKTWIGILPLMMGIGLYWIGELSGEYYSLYLSSWFALTGICIMHFGWEKFKTILFPIAFIICMFPPPNFVFQKISLKLKLISSKLGVDILQLFGMSAYREGNVIDLGFTQLQVVDACSGLRYLIPLIVLAILVAYFSKGALWKKIVLVVSAIPISITINSMRIALVGALYPIWGKDIAEGFLHDFSGWLIFMLSLGILLLELILLNKIFGKTKKKTRKEDGNVSIAGDMTGPGVRAAEKSSQMDTRGLPTLLNPPHFIVAVILLGSTLALAQSFEFRDEVKINKPFHLFPLQIGEWSGKKQSLEQRIIDELDFSDYITADYSNPRHQKVGFYTAFYDRQSKGASIHSPESCLPGGGWLSEKAGEHVIPLDSGSRSMRVNRALIRRGDYRQLVYYWFPSRGRLLTNAYQLKLYTFWDALTRQRTDGALVRIITPVYPDEKISQAEERLQGFVQKAVPLLDEFLPQ